MSGIEVTGRLMSAFPLYFSTYEHYGYVKTTHATVLEKIKANSKEHGYITTFFLYTVFGDALFIMDQVEGNVVHTNDQSVVGFLKSYSSGFNMIGVSGAIIAQVAISAMSLSGIQDSHWTVQAFLIASVVAGCLSVYFACAVNPAFHGLHCAEDIKTFLTKPLPSEKAREFLSIVSENRRQINRASSTSGNKIRKLRILVEAGRWKVASPYAAIILTLPRRLLNAALNALIIGLGIHLGVLLTKDSVASYGSSATGIFVLYLLSATLGPSLYSWANGMKETENALLQKIRDTSEVCSVDKLDGHTQIDLKSEDATSNKASSPSPNVFPRSVHIREGGKVHFTTQANDNICIRNVGTTSLEIGPVAALGTD